MSTRRVITDAAVRHIRFARQMLDGGERLHVLRNDDAGYRTRRLRDPHRAVNDVTDRKRVRNRLAIRRGDVFEERVEIDFLLITDPPKGSAVAAKLRVLSR
jgi:hypothetical protein